MDLELPESLGLAASCSGWSGLSRSRTPMTARRDAPAAATVALEIGVAQVSGSSPVGSRTEP